MKLIEKLTPKLSKACDEVASESVMETVGSLANPYITEPELSELALLLPSTVLVTSIATVYGLQSTEGASLLEPVNFGSEVIEVSVKVDQVKVVVKAAQLESEPPGVITHVAAVMVPLTAGLVLE